MLRCAEPFPWLVKRVGDLSGLEYNKFILYLAYSCVKKGSPAESVRELTRALPISPGDLSTFYYAAAALDATTVGVGGGAVAGGTGDGTEGKTIECGSIFRALGLAWKARMTSVEDSARALELAEEAREAGLVLPRFAPKGIARDVFTLAYAAEANALRRAERFQAASAALDGALGWALRGSGHAPLLADLLSLWASLLMDLGNVLGAETALLVGEVLASGDEDVSCRIHTKLGLARLNLGEAESARHSFATAMAGEVPPKSRRYLRLNLALAAAEAGDTEYARGVLAGYTEDPEATPWALAMVDRVRGLILRAFGEGSGAFESLKRASGKFADAGDAQGVALCCLDCARILVQREKPAEAAALAAEAGETLALLGVGTQALTAWELVIRAARTCTLTAAAAEQIRRTLPAVLLSSRHVPPS